MTTIHSILYSVAQPMERGFNNYYSIIQGDCYTKTNYVASCSFGKDSLAAIVAAERAGVHIGEAVYCWITFDRETLAELPEHEEFIHYTAILLLKSRYGINTTIIQEELMRNLMEES